MHQSKDSELTVHSGRDRPESDRPLLPDVLTITSTSMRKHTILLVGASFLLGLVALLAAGAAWRPWSLVPSSTPRATPDSVKLRSTPISIRPRLYPCLSVPIEDMRKIRAQVEPLEEGMSTSLYLHILRVFGLDSKYSRGRLTNSGETLRLFADDEFSKELLGVPIVARTPHGVRCAPVGSGGAQESHRDFCLAVLSEQGIPASFSMTVGGKQFTFKDLLADSIANFHLEQEEIEWTALTYAMWLPPARQWENKFGDSFSFDDLATELMSRPLDEATCVGSHVVQALIMLARVDDEECAILSPDIKDRLVVHLATTVHEMEVAQAADGSWSADWYTGLLRQEDSAPEARTWSVASDSLERRLVATSHLPELLMLLPDELRVADERLLRAGRWLLAQLRDVDPPFVKNNFCPCTHGAIVLQMVSRADESAVDQSREPVYLPVHAENER